jgi:hypothetical protein
LDKLKTCRSTIPAVTHVDYSARVQTVDERRHGRFRRLLERFFAKTGCPLVINTSFNVRGEPIVCTPAEAHRCFQATHIDALVLGCTHYPLLKSAIRKIIHQEIKLVDSAQSCACYVREELAHLDLLTRKRQRRGRIYPFVTDDVDRFRQMARRFLPVPTEDPIKVDVTD